MPRRDRTLWNASDLTIPEAAKVLLVSDFTIRRYCREGWLESYVRLLGKPPRKVRLIPVYSVKALQKRMREGTLTPKAIKLRKLLMSLTEDQLAEMLKACDLD